MGSRPKAAKEDISTIRLRRQQLAELDDLDKEQNIRVKRLQMSAVGARVFRGSADSRMRPADSPGSPDPGNYGLKMSDAPGRASNSVKAYKNAKVRQGRSDRGLMANASG